MLEASKFKSLQYNIMTKILIFMHYFVILGIPNLIINLSQRLRPVYVIDLYDSIVDLNII